MLGNPAALGQAFHITQSRSWSWNEIFLAMAAAIGVDHPELVHVATDTLVRYEPEWVGKLHGDKSASVNGRTLEAATCLLADGDEINLSGTKMTFFAR